MFIFSIMIHWETLRNLSQHTPSQLRNSSLNIRWSHSDQMLVKVHMTAGFGLITFWIINIRISDAILYIKAIRKSYLVIKKTFKSYEKSVLIIIKYVLIIRMCLNNMKLVLVIRKHSLIILKSVQIITKSVLVVWTHPSQKNYFSHIKYV